MFVVVVIVGFWGQGGIEMAQIGAGMQLSFRLVRHRLGARGRIC